MSCMKRRAGSSRDPHPKPEIIGAFDLCLNTDLCECAFASVDNGMKKENGSD